MDELEKAQIGWKFFLRNSTLEVAAIEYRQEMRQRFERDARVDNTLTSHLAEGTG